MENFNYLTAINAVKEDDFNVFYTLRLLVYTNKSGDILIKFIKIKLNKDLNPITNKGEIILNNKVEPELEFIREKLEKNKKLIKELIFSKFLKYCEEPLIFKYSYTFAKFNGCWLID